MPNTATANKEVRRFKQPSPGAVIECDDSTVRMKNKNERFSPEQPDDPVTSNSKISVTTMSGSSESSTKPSFVPLDSEDVIAAARASRKLSAETWRLEMDSLNVLMNQVLEQMEKGPVSMTLIARIKSHPFYDSRPMVKELLESIIAAQPPSVQEQASKLIQQQSQELIKRQTAGVKQVVGAVQSIGGAAIGITDRRNSKVYDIKINSPVKIDEKRISGKYQSIGITHHNGQTQNFGERPWHSVEVGFDPDEDVEQKVGTPKSLSHNDEVTEVTVQDTSFEDESDGEIIIDSDRNQSKTNLRDHDEALKDDDEECDEEDEDDEEVEESDSEIDELGEEVEQIDDENPTYRTAILEGNPGIPSENNPPPDPHMKIVIPQFVDPFDRGLVKRQSKGKYQHSKVELYGRGVSTECESPTLPHRRIGGPQPTIERSPFLFDKAKKYIMTYPKPIDDSGDDIPGRLGKKIVKKWLRTQDPDIMISNGKSAAESRVCSAPPCSPPSVIKPDDEVSESESEDDDVENGNEGSDEEESSEEDEVIDVTTNKRSVEIEKRKAHSVDREMNAVAGDGNYQIKSKSKDEYNKNDVSMPRRKISEPIKLGNRSLAIPSYDTAVSFLLHHNRDRRRRNRTIDYPGNVSKSIAEHHDEMTPSRYTPGTSVRSVSPGLTPIERTFYPMDPFYSHNKFLKESNGRDLTGAGYPNPAYSQNVRFNDDSFKRATEKDRVSPTRLNFGLNHNLYMVREDKRKSKSVHEISPDRPDLYAGTTTNVSKLTAPGSSNIVRYDNESSIPQSWAFEPKRFYVYQTRAEREAEKNAAVGNLHPSSMYRTAGSSWYTGPSTVNHPISSYAPDYKSRYDDGYLYRRNNAYDIDNGLAHNIEITPNIQNQTNHESSNVVAHRYRPVGRHISSVLGDPIRRMYGRSNSVERSALRQDDLEHYVGFRNFLTPEVNNGDKGEYNYVSFHDTAAIRGSTPHDSDHSKLPTRGILKNKQHKCYCQLQNKSIIHIKLENADNDNRASVEISSTGNGQGMGGGKDQTSATAGKISKDESSKTAKKRSLFLALGRRRTTEIRLGPDGKIMTGGMESDFKRPSSPIDKIKSLFRRSKESMVMPPSSNNYANLDYANFPSSSSSRYGFTDKVYGVYPSSHLTSAITRDSYAPQYRKYTAAITTPGSNYNRYNYATGTNDRASRHWHDDPHMY